MHRALAFSALASTLVAGGLSSAAGPGNAAEFATAGVLYGCAASPMGAYCVPCAEAPWFTFSADAFLMQLDRGTREAVPVVLSDSTQQTLLTTHDLRFSMQAGPRFALGIHLDQVQSLEMVYFGLHHGTATRRLADANNLRIPGDLALATDDFFMADRMRIEYRSAVHNAEANYWQRVGFSQVYVMAGFRYFSLGERFNINAEDFGTGTSDYRIDARNDLYGAQIGGRWESAFGPLDLAYTGKAGFFTNLAGQRTFMEDLDNTFLLRDFNTSGSRNAFVGEVGMTASLQISQGVAARAGYHLMWVQGIARAADQLDFTDTPESGAALVFGNGAFLQGVSIGIEAQW